MKQCLSAVLHPTARPGKGTWWWLIFYCLCCTANHMVCLSAAKLSIVRNYTAWWQSHWSAKNLLQVNMWWHIDWELKFQLSVRKVSLTLDYYTNMVGSLIYCHCSTHTALQSVCLWSLCIWCVQKFRCFQQWRPKWHSRSLNGRKQSSRICLRFLLITRRTRSTSVTSRAVHH